MSHHKIRKFRYSVYNSYTGRSTTVKSSSLKNACVMGRCILGTKTGIVRAYRIKWENTVLFVEKIPNMTFLLIICLVENVAEIFNIEDLVPNILIKLRLKD